MLARLDTGATQTFSINDRVNLRYEKTGSGPPIVLMHTIRTQLEYFRDVVPRLAERFTVYAVDLPGHGGSSKDGQAAYDEPYIREVLAAFLDGLDLRDVTLAGESIGGALAMTVAAARPDRVKAVVASNPYDYETRYGDGVRRGNFFANIVIGSFAIPIVGAINAALENKYFLGPIFKGGLHDNSKLPKDLLSLFDRTGRRKGYRTVERKVFSGWRSWREAKSQYADIKAPVTLIYGVDDWSNTKERKATADAAGAATVIELPQTGHFAVLERPGEIADAIAAAANAA